MQMNEYQEQTNRTAGHHNNWELALANNAMGCAGEAGEVVDLAKKILFHGHPLDEETRFKIAKELGDQLWYIAQTARTIGFSLDTIAILNIEKLKNRYPTGFSEELSRNRTE